MKKRAILIHGWQGTPLGGWRPWLKKKLEKKGFEVIIPKLPNPNHPKKRQWINAIKKAVCKPDKECSIVGHSLGCIATLRYLETLKKGQTIGNVILVAGFTVSLGPKELLGFYSPPLNFEKMKKHCKKFVAIHSDNDPHVPLFYKDIFKKKLGAKIIVMHNMKHFSGSDGVYKLPVVYKELISK